MFWIFIGLIIAASIIAGAIQKRARLEIIRAAVEKGQPLDPALLDRLLRDDEDAENAAEKSKKQPRNPMRLVTGLQIGAIMVASFGVGISIIGILTSENLSAIKPEPFAASALVVCIGLGLYLSSRLVMSSARARAAAQKGQPQDPALLAEHLNSDGDSADTAGKVSPRDPMRAVTGLQIGAIMVASVSVGISIIGILTSENLSAIKPEPFGMCALFACISLGLYLSSRLIIRRARASDCIQ